MPFLDTTLAAELGHNSSAYSLYNRGNFATNFQGRTHLEPGLTPVAVDSNKYDDSLNPISPAHISPRPISDWFPGITVPIGTHVMLWFNPLTGSHRKFGYNSNTDAWADAMIGDVNRRGLNFISTDWYGRGTADHDFQDDTMLRIKSRIAAIGGGLKYCIQIDVAAKMGAGAGYATTAELVALLSYVETTYAGDPNYFLIGGKPVVQFFNPPANSGTLDFAAAKAAIATSMYWMFENTNRVGDAYVDSTFEWINPFTSGIDSGDPHNLAAHNFYLTTMHSSGKGSCPVVGPRFNGTLTDDVGWSDGKALPSDNGQCFIDRAARIVANPPVNMKCIMIVTWNDKEEGSGIEEGVDNDCSVSASIAGNILTFGLSGGIGDESTLHSYKIIASPNGVDAATLAVIPAGGAHTFDLGTISGWAPSTTYSVQAIAVMKSCFRNKVSVGRSFIPSAPSIVTFHRTTSIKGAVVADCTAKLRNTSLKAGVVAGGTANLRATSVKAAVIANSTASLRSTSLKAVVICDAVTKTRPFVISFTSH